MPKAPVKATPAAPADAPEPIKRVKRADTAATRIERKSLTDSEEYTNALWYGTGGTGKTTALAALANGGKIVIINAEGGVKRRPLQKRGINTDNIESVVLADYDNKYDTLDGLFWQIKDELLTKPGSVYGVAWDSVTEIAKVVLRDVITRRVATAERTGRGLTDPFFTDRSDFGVQTEQLRMLLRRYRDLPCHFGVSALERRDQDDDGAVHYGPAVGPAFATDLYGYMDVVCHTTVSDAYGDDEYWGHFKPVGKYDAKDRLDAMPSVGLIDPWFDRVIGYVDETMNIDSDPVMAEARARRADAIEAAADTADDE